MTTNKSFDGYKSYLTSDFVGLHTALNVCHQAIMALKKSDHTDEWSIRQELRGAAKAGIEAVCFALLVNMTTVVSFAQQGGGGGGGGGHGGNQIEEAVCQNGIGQGLSLILAAVALYLLIKGGFRILTAADDMGSSKPQVRQEGYEKAKGGAITAAMGIFGPAVIATFLQLLGVETIGCFSFGSGLLFVDPVPLLSVLTVGF